ncbi:MAG TPA: DNA ligase D [Solirubrobacteraceae bacterium]|nr:DNA ligase D [Solirubrobacteraceae bacterium]
MADKLETYRKKRSAEATPEPMGGDVGDSAGRFVIQEHHATRLHWDLRLERGGVLVSFAIPNGLPPDPGVNRMAVHTEDHPLEYIDFHGVIPKGQYGAGTMTIWDHGTYECLKWEPKKIEVALHGEEGLAKGRYALFQTKGREWMIHRMDPPADPEREPMPERLLPMLATLSTDVPAADGWAFEIKWDGVRAIAYSEPGRLRFESRNLRDITGSYPELSKLNRALSHHSAVLDGEIVAFDEHGRPSFGRLQHRMHVSSESAARRLAKSNPVVYVIFDLLWLDGHSLMDLPYEERRERLAALELTGSNWQTPEYMGAGGEELLAASAAQGLEGIVAKRLDCPYEPGRRARGWLKIKNKQRDEFTIVGWLPGEGKRKERIGALLVASDGRYVGRVGTGFNDAELVRLQKLLAPCERGDPPVSNPKKAPKGAIWVEPHYVAEVEFGEWTNDKILRHPAYKGLVAKEREFEPKPLPSGGYEVVVEGRRIKLTNLDKVMYPKAGFTKGDVIDYYRRIATVLLPHLQDRALTLKRYPNGVEAGHFFEKQCPKHRPDWVRTLHWKLPSKTIDFCSCDDLPTLVWLAQLGDLELHTSLARGEDILTPGILAFDLDPGPPATIVECSRVALWLQGMFENLGIESFAKTSGSKGMQIYVPLNTPGITYDGGTKDFARAVAELLEREEPDLVVSRMTKALRPGKVLVDWSQNDEHKTTVNVYSLRAKDRPTVSTPITWDEVKECHEAGDPDLLVFDSEQVLARVDEMGDLFAPVASLKQELPKL